MYSLKCFFFQCSVLAVKLLLLLFVLKKLLNFIFWPGNPKKG